MTEELKEDRDAENRTGHEAAIMERTAMSNPVYRLAVDDVIYSFRDLARRRTRSLFDCHFLALFRDLHLQFGTRVTFNIFFQTHEGDFSLADFPADYREEWKENASWLRLAFHARQEFPADQYEGNRLEVFRRDFEATRAEVLRFAGPETWIPPAVIHFCRIPDNSLATLAGYGVRHLAGLNNHRNGAWSGHYNVSGDLAARVARNETVVEPESGICFSLIDLVINNCPLDEIAAHLQSRAETPSRPHKIDLLTHEQYSWPFYSHYLPDHPERIVAAIRWCRERGYQPVFYNHPQE